MGKHTYLIEAETVQELADKVAELHSVFSGTTTSAAVAPASEAPKRAKKKKEEPEETTETVEETTETGSEDDFLGGAEEAEKSALTVKECQDALKEVAEKKDVATAKKILAHFKVEKTSALKPEQFEKFVETCKKALAK